MKRIFKKLYTTNNRFNKILINTIRYLALKIFNVYNIKLDFVQITKPLFFDYCKNNNITERYSNLVKSLDPKSKTVVDILIFRLLDDEKLIYSYKMSKNELKDLAKINNYNWRVSEEDTSFSPDFYRTLFPGFSNYEISVFKFHHGLGILDKNVENYIKNKDCIDGGGYEFDSAVIFSSQYPFNKIYSFEIDENNFNRGSAILKKYPHLSNIVTIKKGLWNINQKAMVKGQGGMGSQVEISTGGDVDLTTIDDFVKEHNSNLGFIKLDIEGAEYNAILGAKNTIKSQLPILSVSIYHNLKDFFEIKPLIESIAPNQYNFHIRKLTPFYNIQETYLLCIPKKLDIKIYSFEDLNIYG